MIFCTFLQVFTFEFSFPSGADSSPVKCKPSEATCSVSDSYPVRSKPSLTPQSEYRHSLSSPAAAGGYHLQKEGGADAGKEGVSSKGPAVSKPHGATSLSTLSQTKPSVHKPVACRVTRHSPPTGSKTPASAGAAENTNIRHSSPKSDTHARPRNVHQLRREGSGSPSLVGPVPGREGREASRSPSHPSHGPYPSHHGHSSRFVTFLSKKPPLPVFTGISAGDSESIYDIPWTSYPRAPSTGLNKSQSLKALTGEVG